MITNKVLVLSGLLCWSCSTTLQTVPLRAQSTNATVPVLVLLQIDALQHSLTAEQPGWLGFCHNDLQYGNMLLAAHTASPQPKSLLPAEDNVTQGLGREDALTGLGDRTLGSSADLNPLLASLLSENLEGMSPRKAGQSNGAFWDGHPSFGKGQSSQGEGASDSAADPLEDLDPAQILTHESEDGDQIQSSTAAPEKLPSQLPSQLPTQLHISTTTADPPADAHIRLIDYEYAGVNPVALDLANHWCEYAADYHTDTPHILDYSKFPDHEHQAGFIHAYIETVVSMSKKHGDKLSWDGGEISYSAPAPGAMQIHTDADCNQSLYSKDAIGTSLQGGSKMSQAIMTDAASSAPAATDAPLQVSLCVFAVVVPVIAIITFHITLSLVRAPCLWSCCTSHEISLASDAECMLSNTQPNFAVLRSEQMCLSPPA